MALGHVNTMNKNVINITDKLIDICRLEICEFSIVISLDFLRKSINSNMFTMNKRANGTNEYKYE